MRCYQDHAIDPSTSNRLYQIIEKDELVKLGGPRNAAFYLEGELGVMFSGAATGGFFRPATLQGNHGYLPTKPGLQTGFHRYRPGHQKRCRPQQYASRGCRPNRGPTSRSSN